MKYKDGVYIEATKIVNGKPIVITFSTPIKKAIKLVDSASKSTTGKEIVITSGLDGKHSRKSLHYSGNAFDIRTFIYTTSEVNKLIPALKLVLGSDYDVVYEGNHIHIEYDPK
jgi:hypothetical protein